MEQRVKKLIRDVPDFPKPGIIFKDITPLLKDGPTFSALIDHLADRYREQNIDGFVGIESRGFIFGAALAKALDRGFIPVRKPGKLPYETIGADYELEYGTDRVEMHIDAVKPGERVVLVDDLLATGGTAAATKQMLERAQAHLVEVCFVIELGFLDGRKKLDGAPTYSVVTY